MEWEQVNLEALRQVKEILLRRLSALQEQATQVLLDSEDKRATVSGAIMEVKTLVGSIEREIDRRGKKNVPG